METVKISKLNLVKELQNVETHDLEEYPRFYSAYWTDFRCRVCGVIVAESGRGYYEYANENAKCGWVCRGDCPSCEEIIMEQALE